MPTSRRDFLNRAAASTLMLGALPSFDHLAEFTAEPGGAPPADKWDMNWVKKVTGKYKAVMDVPEVDSGYGVWRASVWASQFAEVMGAKPADTSTVLVLRHHGLALGMKQSYWDKYGIAKLHGAMHPVTEKATDRNPALLSSKRKEQPADYDALALDQFISRGGIVLGCNLALGFCAKMVAEHDKISQEAAVKIVTAALVPGVIMQPSGVFAVIRAQQAGCAYVRAS